MAWQDIPPGYPHLPSCIQHQWIMEGTEQLGYPPLFPDAAGCLAAEEFNAGQSISGDIFKQRHGYEHEFEETCYHPLGILASTTS